MLVTAGVAVGIGIGDVAVVEVGVGGLATSNEKSTTSVVPSSSTLVNSVNSPVKALKLITKVEVPLRLPSIAGGHTIGVLPCRMDIQR